MKKNLKPQQSSPIDRTIFTSSSQNNGQGVDAQKYHVKRMYEFDDD